MIARRRCLLELGPQIPSRNMSAEAAQRFTGWQKKPRKEQPPRWVTAPYVGGDSPGDDIHLPIWDAVSSRRALSNRSSRSLP
jgi:hypothetical protein